MSASDNITSLVVSEDQSPEKELKDLEISSELGKVEVKIDAMNDELVKIDAQPTEDKAIAMDAEKLEETSLEVTNNLKDNSTESLENKKDLQTDAEQENLAENVDTDEEEQNEILSFYAILCKIANTNDVIVTRKELKQRKMITTKMLPPVDRPISSPFT